MEAIDVKGTIAFVRSGFPAAPAEKLAATEVTTEGIWFVFSFHVFTLPLPSNNQWIDSLPVRFA
jgi:hypothetical protein